jgi:hypothetical protein
LLIYFTLSGEAARFVISMSIELMRSGGGRIQEAEVAISVAIRPLEQ